MEIYVGRGVDMVVIDCGILEGILYKYGYDIFLWLYMVCCRF